MLQQQHDVTETDTLFGRTYMNDFFLKRIDISRIEWQQDQFDAMEDDDDGEGDMNSYYTEFYV
jgi:hypothetical protein